MSIVKNIREVRCKDCEHFRYYYKRNRKAHWCVKHDISVTLKDRTPSCLDNGDFVLRKEFYPKHLDYDKRND